MQNYFIRNMCVYFLIRNCFFIDFEHFYWVRGDYLEVKGQVECLTLGVCLNYIRDSNVTFLF
jgi:hypothetical protein